MDSYKGSFSIILNFDLICRTCLKKSNDMKSIFMDDGNQELHKMLQSCTDINILDKLDRLPPNMCSECLNKMRISYEFRQQCGISMNALVNMIETLENEKIDFGAKNGSSSQEIDIQVVNDYKLYNSLSKVVEEGNHLNSVDHLRIEQVHENYMVPELNFKDDEEYDHKDEISVGNENVNYGVSSDFISNYKYNNPKVQPTSPIANSYNVVEKDQLDSNLIDLTMDCFEEKYLITETSAFNEYHQNRECSDEIVSFCETKSLDNGGTPRNSANSRGIIVSPSSTDICCICQEAFVTPKLLLIHMNKFHKDDLKQMSNHEFDKNFEKAVEIYQCDRCSNKYKMSIELNEHIMQEHPHQSCETILDDMNLSISNENYNKVSITEMCSSVIDLTMECVDDVISECNVSCNYNHANYEYHQNDKTFDDELSCDLFCEPKNDQIAENSFNSQYIHLAPSTGINCPICQKTFTTQKQYLFHMRICHKPLKKWMAVCKLCNRTFHEQFNYFQHMKLKHNNDKMLECNKCDAKFSLFRDLQRHYNLHLDMPFYNQEIWDKDYNFHKDIHRNIKQFKDLDLRRQCEFLCLICENRAGSVLKCNDRSHKLFKCNISGGRFRNLINHRCIKHDRKRFRKCNNCGDIFFFITKHKVNMRGKKLPKRCDICGKNFLYLQRHKRIVHGFDKNKSIDKFIVWFMDKLKDIN